MTLHLSDVERLEAKSSHLFRILRRACSRRGVSVLDAHQSTIHEIAKAYRAWRTAHRNHALAADYFQNQTRAA